MAAVPLRPRKSGRRNNIIIPAVAIGLCGSHKKSIISLIFFEYRDKTSKNFLKQYISVVKRGNLLNIRLDTTSTSETINLMLIFSCQTLSNTQYSIPILIGIR
jgi:hypothetical protein